MVMKLDPVKAAKLAAMASTSRQLDELKALGPERRQHGPRVRSLPVVIDLRTGEYLIDLSAPKDDV